MQTTKVKSLQERKKTCMNACKHQNVEVRELQKTKYDFNSRTNIDIPNTFVREETCLSCKEKRNTTFTSAYFVTQHHLKNQHLFAKNSYTVSETFYTNAGNLVERSKGGEWYWNGQKMTLPQLQKRLTQTGDSLGRQDVSDSFKDLCYQAKYKSLEIRYGKDELHERARDHFR